ncbi:MAG: hypothetical protein RLZZ387_459 [Chloroflexota bacterium]|jgi:nitrite reductase/ring-hydroxylating ferredoxin subunit/uncharacterized membrane protein
MVQNHTGGAGLPSAFGSTEVERTIKNIPGLEEAGLRLSRAVHEAVLSGGEPTRALADVLHGVWLGHSLHAAMVTLPIGAWTSAAAFDAYAAVSGAREAEWAADRLLTLGVVAAIPTAMAGLTDYSAIKKDAAALGMAHALLNSTALSLFLGSLWARAARNRGLGVLLSTAGLAAVTVSGVLGGDLSYRRRVGVNHAPSPTGPEQWTRALALEELDLNGTRRVEVDGAPVLLYRDADGIHAIGAVCSHAGGPLEEGKIANHCVECPWHQSVFDLRTGEVVHGPATHAQPAYEARVWGNQVEVRLVRSESLEGAAADERAAAPSRQGERVGLES